MTASLPCCAECGREIDSVAVMPIHARGNWYCTTFCAYGNGLGVGAMTERRVGVHRIPLRVLAEHLGLPGEIVEVRYDAISGVVEVLERDDRHPITAEGARPPDVHDIARPALSPIGDVDEPRLYT